MTYDTTLTVAPTGEPLHVDHVKLHCGIWDTDRDALLAAWITAAREDAQARTNQQLLHARYALRLAEFPAACGDERPRWAEGAIVLPHWPVTDVVSVQYVDADGATQTIAAADYELHSDGAPAFVVPAYGVSWPSTREGPAAVIVTYNAGYASVATANAGADTLTVTGPRTWAVDAPVRLSVSGGPTAALPAPLAAGTTYYIKTAAAGVYTLAATAGGATIDLTDTGSGRIFIGEIPAGFLSWMLLQVGSLADVRAETEVVERGTLTTAPFVDRLLDRLRVWLP